MKKILILGAGLVSRPGTAFLLENGFKVTVASQFIEEAQRNVQGFENGTAVFVDVQNEEALDSMVKEHDIVISLLPWTFHVSVARACLKNNKHMATASYASEDMKKLDSEAKAKNLLFLNEIGVDPGFDHMSAMKIINDVHSKGGKIHHFYSFCGGLPAPDDNDNPFGYKFSWSPRGVVLASKNSARFLENGKEINIKGEDLFLNPRREIIEGLGEFELYPNRDSVPYKEIYGLKDAQTVMRGTYRNIGWCETFKKIVDLGLAEETPVQGLSGITFKKMMGDIAGVDVKQDVMAEISDKLGISKDHFVIKNLDWLGLFSDEPVSDQNNYLDILSDQLQKKLYYKPGEKDMLLMRHSFVVENPDGSENKITSTLIDFGIPNGDSSMARTVSLPLAIGVKMMAEEKIKLTGVRIPLDKEIYEPVLDGLEGLGIKMKEEVF